MIESLLLSATHVFTYADQQRLSNASGFFFERDGRLFVVTSRHVVIDEPGHVPDRIEIELHIDPDDMARSVAFSIPLYRDGRGIWRQGVDIGGQIDVAVVEIERPALPPTTPPFSSTRKPSSSETASGPTGSSFRCCLA